VSSYPFRLPNYRHQQAEFDRHKDDDARALLWQMRTGKTKSVLDVVCYRHIDRFDIDGLLVIAPNGVHVNWVRRQLPMHMWSCIDYYAHAYQASEAHKRKHQQQLEACLEYRGGLAVLAVNSESLQQDKVKALIKRFLKKRRVFLVADESHDFRSPGSKRTKTVRGIAKACKAKRILSGTAVSNSPLAAYSQFEILQPHALGWSTFGEFEARYALFINKKNGAGQTYRLLDRYVNLDELQERMAWWASVVLRKDVDDMPSLLLDEVTVELSAVQKEAYDRLLKEFILELDEESEVTAEDGGVRIMKLQQILGGFVVDSTGRVHELVADEENPRLMALMDQVVKGEGKNIIWCKYQEDLKRVVRTMRGAGRSVVEYHGRIHSQAKRQAAIDAFMTDPTVTDFVGQPAAGGEGLDLSIASTIYWYSHTFDLIERDQANERATQVGGKSVAIVDIVVPGTVDEYILKTLERKRSVSDELAGEGLRDRLLALFREML
jgi:SNF2 family DNA or RNA helicase